MIFLSILGGGLFGAFTAVKCKILQNWNFLVSSVFSAYFAILATPAVVEMLKDIKEIPPAWKASGTVIVLFAAFMIIFSKITAMILDETDPGEIPAAAEKSLCFILGFCSGMILVSVLLCSLVSVFPVLQGEPDEIRTQRKTSIRNVANGLLRTGNILFFTAGRSEKQQLILEKSFPFLEEEVKKEDAGNADKENVPEVSNEMKKLQKKGMKKYRKPGDKKRTAGQQKEKQEEKKNAEKAGFTDKAGKQVTTQKGTAGNDRNTGITAE